MLLLIGAITTAFVPIFFVLAILALIRKNYLGLKVFSIIAVIAVVFTGAGFYVDSLLYEEVTVKEYEVLYVGDEIFSYKTEDGGILNKNNCCKVYKSSDDRAYVEKTISTVKSKINKTLHYFLTCSNKFGIQGVEYKIYLPEEKYQEYISRWCIKER